MENGQDISSEEIAKHCWFLIVILLLSVFGLIYVAIFCSKSNCWVKEERKLLRNKRAASQCESVTSDLTNVEYSGNQPGRSIKHDPFQEHGSRMQSSQWSLFSEKRRDPTTGGYRQIDEHNKDVSHERKPRSQELAYKPAAEYQSILPAEEGKTSQQMPEHQGQLAPRTSCGDRRPICASPDSEYLDKRCSTIFLCGFLLPPSHKDGELDFPKSSWKRQSSHIIGSGHTASKKQQKTELGQKDILHYVQMIGIEGYMQITPANEGTEIQFQFLRKLMALEETARSTSSVDMNTQSAADLDFVSPHLHHLDVLCDILNNSCKNHISQQKIIKKMALCHFSIPLLLPAVDGSCWTFMLCAMRDIVKRWRPHLFADTKGFREDNLVNISMPFCSFVRLGKCNLSKSKILNHILSPMQQIHNFFVHKDMDGGNSTKIHSNGLVEISWYFPSGQVIDVFSEPIAVANLRGDLENHSQQFRFLLSISAAVFIFVENLNEEQYKLLSGLSEKRGTQFFFVINVDAVIPGEDTLRLLNKLLEVLKLQKMNIIVKNKNVNVPQVVMKLQSIMKSLFTNNTKILSLHDIAKNEIRNKSETYKNHISVDEDSPINKSAKKRAKYITEGIKDIQHYKNQTLKLQGDLWRKLTKMEKELCRMRELGDKDPEEYKSQLQKEILELRKEQSSQKLPQILKMFIDAMTRLNSEEKQLFIKWLAIYLDKVGRRNLSMLQGEYKEKMKDLFNNASELKIIDQRIADSSLGVEHFLREIGQFYEAAKFMKKRGPDTDKTYYELPRIASDMLQMGFPLELMDGDASNIPLIWISDVLKELDIMTGGQSRIRVITVLGVQSTGKSTLLNTMFGLDFPVASGRCTRGAFMNLLYVDTNFQKILGCQFILVIDTEGLKSMELASLEGSYEHDNELATVVVGLSDITIVNMAMENTEEMKDILQIVVHAFLRMKEVGKKPSCHFVHQNVSDVSAHVKNQRARQKFLEQLNELTKIAAIMEKRGGIAVFSDIIICDLEKHSWYIPGLWHGIPPMASINTGYSKEVKEFKKSIIESLVSMPVKPQTIKEFTEWLKSLWNAVKHEKFIFSFRNRLVTEAYNQLCMEYSDWEWRFQKNVHHWIIKTETWIYNLMLDELGQETWNMVMNELYQLLDKEERVMSKSLENYFEQGYDNAHLLDMFRGDFFRSVHYLRKELENTLIAKCEKTMHIQREKCEIQVIQEQFINILEVKVAEIITEKRRNKNYVSPEQLKREFDMIWKSTLDTIELSKLETQNIEGIIIQQLIHDMKHDEQSLKKLHRLKSLAIYETSFTINETHHSSKSSKETILIQNLTSILLNECNLYVSKCVNTSTNFHEMFSQELLQIIKRCLKGRDARQLSITKGFELDIKLHILGNAAPKFQKMHNDFVQKNDPKLCLEKLKPEYLSAFQNIFEKSDESQRRAEQFCELCLQPAIIDHVNRHLGKEIVEKILQKGGPLEFKSHTLFQNVLMRALLQQKSCAKYTDYINHYKHFVEKWIFQYIHKHFGSRNIQTLQLGILQSLTNKIMHALNRIRAIHVSDLSALLDTFCSILKTELVVCQNNLNVVRFQSRVDIGKFINDIEMCLPDLLQKLQNQMRSANFSDLLSQLNIKPHEELAKKVIGCGNQCPFCKAPCEAGGADHKEHFTSMHRPRGLAQYKNEQTGALDHSICSTNVISNRSFRSAKTEWRLHPYKDYRTIYPDWAIYPNTATNSSDYWKFVFKELNDQFSALYKAKPANLPQDWYRITEDQAIESLKTT